MRIAVQMGSHRAVAVDRGLLAPELCYFAGDADGAVGEGVEEVGGYARGGDGFCHFWVCVFAAYFGEGICGEEMSG